MTYRKLPVKSDALGRSKRVAKKFAPRLSVQEFCLSISKKEETSSEPESLTLT
jgi:hypothetical protein